MLVRLPSKLIAQYWDFYKDVIRQAVPTTIECAPDRIQRIFEACMLGSMQCWMLGDGDDLVGAAITRVEIDDVMQQNRLFIFAHHVWKPVPLAKQVEWFYPILEFAKKHNCARICANILDEKAAKEYARLTGSTIQYFANMELGG